MPIQPQTHCEAFWRGKMRRFALALHEGYIHFWEPDSPEFQEAPEEWAWVIEGKLFNNYGQRNKESPPLAAEYFKECNFAVLGVGQAGPSVGSGVSDSD